MRGLVYAVNGISFDIAPGETLGIVGESGCGKSVTSLALLGILARNGRITRGSATFEGRTLMKLPKYEPRKIRGKEIEINSPNPMTTMNQAHTCKQNIR